MWELETQLTSSIDPFSLGLYPALDSASLRPAAAGIYEWTVQGWVVRPHYPLFGLRLEQSILACSLTTAVGAEGESVSILK